MKRILVPTDFSRTARGATKFAVESAKLLNADLTLLHSYELEQYFATDNNEMNNELFIRMMQDVENKQEEAIREIMEEDNIEAESYLSTLPLKRAINKVVNEKKMDLIVMGTLGTTGFVEKIWGSRTSSVIGETKIPILTIPHDYKWKKPSKILFLTNHFEKKPEILNFIFELAGLYMANIEVGVFTDIDDEKAEKYVRNKTDIEEYQAYLKDEYYENTLTSSHIIGTDFEEAVQKHIQDNEIDMMIMVTYQGGFWKRLFNPSMTKMMSYHSDIPLLAIPAQ